MFAIYDFTFTVIERLLAYRPESAISAIIIIIINSSRAS